MTAQGPDEGGVPAPVECPVSARIRTMLIVDVASLDYEGRGVARVEGKAVFVESPIPQYADRRDQSQKNNCSIQSRHCALSFEFASGLTTAS